MANSNKELDELEGQIEYVIQIIDGNVRVIDECLIHFETSKNRYSLPGREYCIYLLKCVIIRLREK